MAKPHPSELLASLSSTVPAETFIKMLSKSLYPALDSLPASQRRNIVSTIAPRYPSELLASLSSNVPAQAFYTLLSKSLYPALDSLPDAQRSNIVSILETTLKTDVKRAEWVELVGYEAMAKSLRSQLGELKKDVRHNWKSGYEYQGDMMSEIAGTIDQWLSTLWTVGIEEGVERPLIQKCLKLCHNILDQVEDCGSLTELSEILELGASVIKDKDGTEVYSGEHGGLYRALAWMWRELLLAILVDDKGDEKAKKIMDYVNSKKLLGEVKELLRKGDETETSSGASFDDEHWSKSTRKAARRLKKLLAGYDC